MIPEWYQFGITKTQLLNNSRTLIVKHPRKLFNKISWMTPFLYCIIFNSLGAKQKGENQNEIILHKYLTAMSQKHLSDNSIV